MNEKTRQNILIGILLVTAFLRLFGLSRGDTLSDEVLIAFRALGMMDFDEAPTQTTPWEWLDPSTSSGQVHPWWLKLSFHDQPPLPFVVQNISMQVFGESAFAFRLPSAILGIASVYLLYLIGRKLFSEKAALFAAALYGVTLNSVYIFRSGLQEPYVIFFVLLAIYWFLKSLEEERYLIWTGVAIGLGVLSKYTAFIIVPILLSYLFFYKKDYFLNKRFWIGAGIAVFLFSPVLIYNWELYKTVGHFDFQFSYIFGQHPDAWKVTPGKEIGTLTDRITNFAPRLVATNSWLFLLLASAGILSFVFRFLKDPKIVLRQYAFLLVWLIWLLVLIFKIGPSYRFLTLLGPGLALVIGCLLAWCMEKIPVKQFVIAVLVLIFGFEIAYAWNNQIAYYPVGPTPWLASKVRYENYNWGYNELGDWLEKELAGKMPAIVFDLKYEFLTQLRDRVLEEDRQKFLEPYPALIVYYGNFDQAAKLWELDRLHIYHGWPIISAQTYFDDLKQNGWDYFDRIGFQKRYFILQNNIVPFAGMEQLARGTPIAIRNQKGDVAFTVYVAR